MSNEDTSSWIIGAGITVYGSIIINLGTNLIKYQYSREEILIERTGIDPNTGEMLASSNTSTSGHINLSQTKKALSRSSKKNPNILGIPNHHYLWHDRLLAKAPDSLLRMAGISLFVVGNLMNFYALALANQTLLSSLGSVQFVVNVVFAYLILHVAITDRILLGTLVICMGNIVVVAGSSNGNQDYDAQGLLELYANTEYIVYLIVCAVLGLLCHIWFVLLDRRFGERQQSTIKHESDDEDIIEHVANVEMSEPKTQFGKQQKVNTDKCDVELLVSSSSQCSVSNRSFISSSIPASPASSLTTSSASISSSSHASSISSTSHRSIKQMFLNRYVWHKAGPVLYASVSATLGTQSLILAKSLSSLLKETFSGESQLTSPVLYIILLSWLFTMWFWLSRMDEALRRFNGAYIIPVLQVFWLFGGICGGGLYFQEFHNFATIDFVLFFIGIALIVFGVSMLAPRVPDIDENTELASEHSIAPMSLMTRSSSSESYIHPAHGRVRGSWTSMSVVSIPMFNDVKRDKRAAARRRDTIEKAGSLVDADEA